MTNSTTESSTGAAQAAPRIAVDAMGGDFGPSVVLPGAIEAARHRNIRLVLVGDSARIEAELEKMDVSGLAIEVVHATQMAEMTDKPTDVVRRKKDASIVVACRLVKEGHADGVVSAGHTGATLACGMFILGRLPGVDRPGLASIMPTEKKPMVLVDVGANTDVKAFHLFQFGIMADALCRNVLGFERPRVGLLSIGEEEGKGTTQVQEAYRMLRGSSLNFVGNVEGRDIFKGDTDIVVCDGFVGNVCLKLSEGLAHSLGRLLKRELTSGFFSKVGTMFSIGALRRFRRLLDYAEYGGAPLLGLSAITIVCHGSSNAKAIMNAVDMAANFVASKANQAMAATLSQNCDLTRFTRGKAANGSGA
ncbi:Phosphate acyltransferase [Desulfovibrio sp. X2]|uniref:phosphate acyltransferase PlsX n=1 Tax=Desulfovibrio sp. X2 TaxID=941449 RepID=UPI000358DA03|nr:phosphate acyltransferase PlsX [Desulfovibrio sp. X2]EPR44782.1 Phosphate acyltransferase [Desulfovibrio sp. X2]